jgi:hypothetical protein
MWQSAPSEQYGEQDVDQGFNGLAVLPACQHDEPMLLPGFRRARLNSFQARIDRARSEGYHRGAFEAGRFKVAMAKTSFEREQALEWLNEAIYRGRAELQAQHALDREIEVWDMSCRIAFLVAIV